MTIEFIETERFKRRFRKLNKNERNSANKQLCLFADDPFYPSLQTERLVGNVYASIVTDDIRFTWEFGKEKSTVILMNI